MTDEKPETYGAIAFGIKLGYDGVFPTISTNCFSPELKRFKRVPLPDPSDVWKNGDSIGFEIRDKKVVIIGAGSTGRIAGRDASDGGKEDDES